MKLDIQTKAVIVQRLTEALSNMEGEDVIEMVENNIDNMTFDEMKKLMMVLLDSCASTHAQEIMIRDTFFN